MRLAPMFGSPEWTSTLLHDVRTAGPDRYGALVVLSRLSRLAASADDLDLIRRLVIGTVRDGGDERWLEGVAALVDSPSLRMELGRLVEGHDDDVRRRARWALNAIRRAHDSG